MFKKFKLFTLTIGLLAFANFGFAEKAPEFSFTSLDGKTVSLSDFKGKVVMVNFWATWCGPCIHEMPALEKLYKTYKEKGFQIIGLTVSSKENQIPIKVKQTGVSYPILLNAEDAVGKFGGFQSIPHTFIINRDGDIVQKIVGARSFEQFEAEIIKLL